MRITLFFLLIIFTSCGSDKIVELPEINQASIKELTDISPAYLFYDETQPDSIELNRKNLISTTNWVVNVDKRLTLKQVIPQIQFLQNKKNNSSHKNEAAKNYFTCHDLSENNLGFIDFTDVVYNLNTNTQDVLNSRNDIETILLLDHKEDKSILAYTILDDKLIERGFFNANNFEFDSYQKIILLFSKSLNFQDYITLKDRLITFKLKEAIIDNNEFIY